MGFSIQYVDFHFVPVVSLLPSPSSGPGFMSPETPGSLLLDCIALSSPVQTWVKNHGSKYSYSNIYPILCFQLHPHCYSQKYLLLPIPVPLCSPGILPGFQAYSTTWLDFTFSNLLYHYHAYCCFPASKMLLLLFPLYFLCPSKIFLNFPLFNVILVGFEERLEINSAGSPLAFLYLFPCRCPAWDQSLCLLPHTPHRGEAND